jgi:hypothetical protein
MPDLSNIMKNANKLCATRPRWPVFCGYVCFVHTLLCLLFSFLFVLYSLSCFVFSPVMLFVLYAFRLLNSKSLVRLSPVPAALSTDQSSESGRELRQLVQGLPLQRAVNPVQWSSPTEATTTAESIGCLCCSLVTVYGVRSMADSSNRDRFAGSKFGSRVLALSPVESPYLLFSRD